MDEIAGTDRTNLPIAKETGARLLPQKFAHQAGIVIRRTEEMATTSIAAKEKRRERLDTVLPHISEQVAQLSIRTLTIAELELQRLTYPW